MFALKGPVVTVKAVYMSFLSARLQKPANILNRPTLLHIQPGVCM